MNVLLPEFLRKALGQGSDTVLGGGDGARHNIASDASGGTGEYQRASKSFMEQERLLGTLLWRLGGDRVGHIVHRALGLPGVNTLRDSSVKIPITPSAGKPTVEVIERNTLSVLGGILGLLENRGDIRHTVVMFDEIACEKRVRWHSQTNKFLGICREHGSKVSLDFVGEGDMEELFRSLDEEDHYASEVRTKGTKNWFLTILPPFELTQIYL
jgi:hypothetical protein